MLVVEQVGGGSTGRWNTVMGETVAEKRVGGRYVGEFDHTNYIIVSSPCNTATTSNKYRLLLRQREVTNCVLEWTQKSA